MNIVRWKYVLPRLAFLCAIGLVLRFGLDPTLRWALISGGESATGATVELSEVRSSLWDGELILKDLALANPQSPMRNLLEATDSQLQIDVNALLHGRVVVSNGTLSGLRFDTDRETSGAITKEPTTIEESNSSILDPLLASAGTMGEQWFDQLGDRLDTDIADQLQSPRLAKELQERWPKQYAGIEKKIKDIRTRGKELEKDIRELQSNPLRGLEKLPSMQKEVAQLQQEVKSVQKQINDLPKQAKSDKQAVLVARKQDEAFIRQQLQVGKIDGEGLTQTLLGKPVTEGLTTALGWISWARKQVPSSSVEVKELRGRGTTVLFTPRQPDYLIEQLQLEGSAQVRGNPLQLTGTLTGVSSAPQLLNEPTILKLRSNDAPGMTVKVELDRRGDVAHDLIQLDCPKLTMPSQTLGNAEKIAIKIGDGVAQLDVDLALHGEKLSGDISFAQESLDLTSRSAKSPNGELSQALNQALAGVQKHEAHVSLAGTLKNPQLKIDSDIGSQVATGLNTVVADLVKKRAGELLAKNRQQVDDQLQKLTKVRKQAQEDLLAQLGEGQELLGQLASLSSNGANGLPVRLPKIGRKFGLDSLRK